MKREKIEKENKETPENYVLQCVKSALQLQGDHPHWIVFEVDNNVLSFHGCWKKGDGLTVPLQQQEYHG